MKRNLFLIVFSTLLLSVSIAPDAAAQQHRVRGSWSDALYLTLGDGILSVMGSAITGDKLDDIKSSGAIDLGYRYLCPNERWTVGGDLVYWNMSETYEKSGKKSFSVFAIMPTAEYYYIKDGVFRLYGSASVGLGIADGSAGVAWQINPIAMRVGSDKCAGFLEVGAGTKGVFTVGIEVGF